MDLPRNSSCEMLCSSIVFEIPATEFFTARTSPPSAKRVPRSNRATRVHNAESLRSASLQSTSHRCRQHAQHVASVAKTVKDSRRAFADAKHQATTCTLTNAGFRRQRFLSLRSEASHSHRQAQNAQQEDQDVKRAFELRNREREEAWTRRGRILSTRKERAARFSTAERATFSSDPVDTDSSLSAMSIASDDNVSRQLDFPDECNNRNSSSSMPSASEATEKCQRQTRIMPTLAVPRPVDIRNAVSCISGYFLLGKARRVLEASGALGHCLASYTFADVTKCLESESAHKGAELVLRAIGYRKYLGSTSEKQAARSQREQRIMLSCLLVALRADSVLEGISSRDDPQGSSLENITLQSARRMLLCLHVGSLEATASAWYLWRRSFTAWRKRDAEKILNALIEDAVATAALSKSVNKEFSRLSGVQDMKNTINGGEGSQGSQDQGLSIWTSQIEQKQKMIHEAVLKFAGEEGIRRLNLALSASKHAQDERTVHEMLIDLPGLLERVRNPAPTPPETWERLRSELSSEPSVHDTLALCLSEMSQNLNSMMPGSFKLADTSPIDLNLDFAVSLVHRASEALKKSQAQAFDEPLQEWTNKAVLRLRSSSTRFVEVTANVLRELSELIRRVKSEVTMYRIQHNAPIVQQYGASWERSRFNRHVASKKFSKRLPRTRRLLLQILPSSRSGDDVFKTWTANSSSAVRGTVLLAIINMISRSNVCIENEIPEVFHLDHDRIVKMQNDVQRCALISSLDNIGRQFLHSRGVSVQTGERQDLLRITNMDSCSLKDIQDTFLTWVQEELTRNGKNISPEDGDFVKNMVTRTTRAGDHMFRMLQSRVERAVLELAEMMGTAQTKTSSSSIPGRVGLEHNQKALEGTESLIRSLSQRVCTLAIHTLLIHSESIVRIIQSAEREL